MAATSTKVFSTVEAAAIQKMISKHGTNYEVCRSARARLEIAKY